MNYLHTIIVAAALATTLSTAQADTLDAKLNACTPIQTLRLGRDGVSRIGGDDPYAGLLDEVRIFNRALAQTEVSSLYGVTN